MKLSLTNKDIVEFQKLVLQKGESLYREMPWRTDTSPYAIILSEFMLQQTQVTRVLAKYIEFKEAFPTLQDLANADFQEVLALWSGLGYNRRAKFLHRTAKTLVQYKKIPKDSRILQTCPGIGENTAAAILVYAYNLPQVFIETNIRTVLIYTFFKNTEEKIEESVLRDIAQQTLYIQNPRKWYWALMDYGTYLKKNKGNFNKYSTKYTVQSKFEGSFRQKRAKVLRCLLQNGPLTIQEIVEKLNINIDLLILIVDSLKKDALIFEKNKRILIQ